MPWAAGGAGWWGRRNELFASPLVEAVFCGWKRRGGGGGGSEKRQKRGRRICVQEEIARERAAVVVANNGVEETQAARRCAAVVEVEIADGKWNWALRQLELGCVRYM